MDEELGSDIYLDGIITVVDAKYGLEQLGDPNLVISNEETSFNTAMQQIALADLILLNKTDKVTGKEKDNVSPIIYRSLIYQYLTFIDACGK